MVSYKSTSGKQSGVIGYEIGDTYITVMFRQGAKYRYSYRSAGSGNVETMKRLALASRGLSTFITQNKPGFE